MKEIIAGKNEAGQRLDKLLGKYLPDAPKSFIYKMLRKKNFTLNGKKAAGSEIVRKQDVIRLFLSDETYKKFSEPVSEAAGAEPYSQSKKSLITKRFPIQKKYPVTHLDIIYESDDYIVINKPAGMLSQKAAKEDISANEYLIGYMLEQGQITPEELKVFHPSVCNRLDRNTSGLLVFGKTLRGLQTMAESLKTRTVRKYYWCLAEGRIHEPQKISGYLKKDKKSNQVTVTDRKSKTGSHIETEYVPLKQYPNHTLLEVHLITGKPHQIRAHLSYLGHPLAGDRKYGGSADILTKAGNIRLSGQFLHAKRLEFPDGTVLEAPLPKKLEDILNILEET